MIVDARHVVAGRERRGADQLRGAPQVVEQVAAGQPRLLLQLAQRVGRPQERAEQDRDRRADARLPQPLVAVRSRVGHREHEQRRDRDLHVLAAVDAQHHADGEGCRQGHGEGRGRPAGQMDRSDADRDAGDDARHPLEGEADDGERVALQGDQRHQRGEHRRVRGAQPQGDLPGAGSADGDPRGLGSLTPGGGAGASDPPQRMHHSSSRVSISRAHSSSRCRVTASLPSGATSSHVASSSCVRCDHWRMAVT